MTEVIHSFRFPPGIDRGRGMFAEEPNHAEHVEQMMLQVLFTAPGERVNMPTFGCGLFNLVFEPNNTILAAAMEFTVGQALTRWLADDLVVDGVNVNSVEETITIEITYTKKTDLSKKMVRIHFR